MEWTSQSEFSPQATGRHSHQHLNATSLQLQGSPLKSLEGKYLRPTLLLFLPPNYEVVPHTGTMASCTGCFKLTEKEYYWTAPVHQAFIVRCAAEEWKQLLPVLVRIC